MLFDPSVKTRPEDFYNYREELDTLVSGLRDEITRMIVIKGIRRIGKSSLLRVGLSIAGKPYVLLDVRSSGEVTVDNIYSVLRSGLEDALRRLSPLREKLSMVEGVEVLGVSVRLRRRGPTVVYEILKALDNASPGPGGLVLAIDEAQYLALIRGFPRVLAHAYDYLRNIKLVLTGSEVGLLDRLLGRRDPSAPLYGRPALEITMRRLSREESRLFLRVGFKELSLDWPEEHIGEAVDALDGIPGWLTYYGYLASTTRDHRRALERTLEEGASIAAREISEFLAPRRVARQRYLAVLRCLRARPMRWSELRRCMEAELGIGIANAQLYRYLRELQEYSFIVKGEEGFYRLADPLYGRALEKVW